MSFSYLLGESFRNSKYNTSELKWPTPDNIFGISGADMDRIISLSDVSESYKISKSYLNRTFWVIRVEKHNF